MTASAYELSVVMPCLNEEASVATCVAEALEGISRSGKTGEVIVVDNGSTDRSAELAAAAGARVITERVRGYGRAYQTGFNAARGRLLVMGDCDETYDFTEIASLIAPLDHGFDLVLGSRFGGGIRKGAMSWSHRYIGNPILTHMLNRLFGLGSSDAHSGMRAFTREAYDRMAPRCDGMEFASELVIKAARAELRVTEVPIVYRPRIGETKLRPVQDAWRHVRFMLLLCPQWLFVVPGMILLLVGLGGQLLLLPGWLTIGGHHLEAHFSVLFAMICLLGGQALTFGVFGRIYGAMIGLEPDSALASWFRLRFRLERGLMAGGLVVLAGFAIDAVILGIWMSDSMGRLNAVGPAILGLTAIVLGTQIVLGSFFVSLLHTDVRGHALPVLHDARSTSAVGGFDDFDHSAAIRGLDTRRGGASPDGSYKPADNLVVAVVKAPADAADT